MFKSIVLCAALVSLYPSIGSGSYSVLSDRYDNVIKEKVEHKDLSEEAKPILKCCFDEDEKALPQPTPFGRFKTMTYDCINIIKKHDLRPFNDKIKDIRIIRKAVGIMEDKICKKVDEKDGKSSKFISSIKEVFGLFVPVIAIILGMWLLFAPRSPIFVGRV